MTGSFWPAGCWAWALCNSPQLQKTTPVAAVAAPAFRKSRRVVMTIPLYFFGSLVCAHQGMLLLFGIPPLRRMARFSESVCHSQGGQQDSRKHAAGHEIVACSRPRLRDAAE
jgi:hypothetical protein